MQTQDMMSAVDGSSHSPSTRLPAARTQQKAISQMVVLAATAYLNNYIAFVFIFFLLTQNAR
jgi:hypothetical protein